MTDAVNENLLPEESKVRRPAPWEIHEVDVEALKGWSDEKLRRHFTDLAERATVGQLATFLVGERAALQYVDEDKPALVQEFVERRVVNLNSLSALKNEFDDVLKDL